MAVKVDFVVACWEDPGGVDAALTSLDHTCTDAVQLWCENSVRFGILGRCSAHECQGSLREHSRRCYEGEKPMGPEHRSSKFNGPAHH